MFITAACTASGLTRKAIAYYEQQGLIAPEILDNGYRDYDDATLARLREIAVLRQCGLTIEDVKQVLDSADKAASLGAMMDALTARQQSIEVAKGYLARLMQAYQPEALWQTLKEGEAGERVADRLIHAFPGSYGRYLSLHFGHFLNVVVDTPDKQAAYLAIVDYLDSVPDFIDDALAAQLEAALPDQPEAIDTMEASMQTAFASILEDPKAYLDGQREFLDEYLAMRTAPEYAQSEAGRFQAALLAFQSASGYQEHFIANLRRISPDYDSYLTRMQAANQALVDQFPLAAKLYPGSDLSEE